MLLCHFCGRSLSNAYALQRHVSTFHGRYACDACGKTFQDETIYSNHRKSCKSNCKFCGLEFTNIEETKEHIAMKHPDEKFQCTRCEKKFLEKRDLKKNLQRCVVSVFFSTINVLAYLLS